MLELFVLHFRKHIVLLNCLLVNVTASPWLIFWKRPLAKMQNSFPILLQASTS
jgi:hypothetical protein